MNQADRKEFELIHNKIDNITQSIDELRKEMDTAHAKVDQNLSFVKENLFGQMVGQSISRKLKQRKHMIEQNRVSRIICLRRFRKMPIVR